MLSTPPELWGARLEGDRERYRDRWDDLVRLRSRGSADNFGPQVWAQRHAQVQEAIAQLQQSVLEAEVDVVIVIGDDQEEVFAPGVLPPIAIWCAGTFRDQPLEPSSLPTHQAASLWAYYAGRRPTVYQGHSDLAHHLVRRLTDRGFDVTTLSPPAGTVHLGHAFTFVQRRLLTDPRPQMIPVLLNTFFPLSQPTVRRCYEMGMALADAVGSWPGRERVAVVASGGLSHQLVDEELDRRLLASLGESSGRDVLSLPDSAFVDGDAPCGTGESKNWILVAGAARVAALRMEVLSYQPLLRTEAGTGVGAAFARWSAN